MKRNTKITILLSYLCAIQSVMSGIAPAIPANGRAEFYLLKNDGSYNYGFDTGDGIYAKQEGSTANEVQGSYTYNSNGELINVKYTSGVEGFKPETSGALRVAPLAPTPTTAWAAPDTNGVVVESFRSADYDDGSSNGDKSYSFAYQSDNHQRQESSDAGGAVKGRYSYTDETGTHDLQYKAGPESGFEVIGGSLAQPNGLLGKQGAVSKASWSHASAPVTKTWTQQTHVSTPVTKTWTQTPSVSTKSSNNDGSYSFEYNTGDSSRQESADPAGNVRGRYSFTNEAGNHDLSYVAGADTGFQVTGGSLATANGLSEAQNAKVWTAPVSKATWSVTQAHKAFIQPQSGLAVKTHYDDGSQNNDGSYSFEYNTGDASRQESGDAAGNVRGRYSYTNEAGNHDLSYVAGSETGFKVTGGSLAQPNGLSEEFNLRSASKSVGGGHSSHAAWTSSAAVAPAVLVKTPDASSDGSYSFEYNTGDASRQESADRAGNVRGRYSFTNDAGNHDLSYVAGADTGFQVTGGSLATANGLSDDFNAKSAAAWRSKAMTKSHVQHSPSSSAGHSLSGGNANGAYSFEYNAGDSSRKESADVTGNVRGAYSYKNDAGTHDLQYVAGPATGFVVTGGSLAKPSELTKSHHVSSGNHHAFKSSHSTTTAIHGTTGSEQAIAGRSVLLKTGSGAIGTKWLPVPENYKSGYYFQY